MRHLKSAILGAVLLAGAGLSVGCGSTGPATRDGWEAELRGSMSPDCHNREHLGFGMHYDIVLTDRQAMTRESAGAPARTGPRPRTEPPEY